MKSEHQKRIDLFMTKAKQAIPDKPTLPSFEVRELRAKLIMEEALETVGALGFSVRIDLESQKVEVFGDYNPSLTLIADGCADLSVVTIGTLSACGIPDKPLLELVDNNNLDKFGPGHTIRSDGKLVKPPGHLPPDIKGLLQVLQGEGDKR